MKKTVLMVEDAHVFRSAVKRGLKGLDPDVTLLEAASLDEARTVFEQHKDEIDLITMDGCVQCELDETCEFVREIRASGFIKPMIAASSAYNRELIEAGCSIYGHLSGLPAQIVRVLSES